MCPMARSENPPGRTARRDALTSVRGDSFSSSIGRNAHGVTTPARGGTNYRNFALYPSSSHREEEPKFKGAVTVEPFSKELCKERLAMATALDSAPMASGSMFKLQLRERFGEPVTVRAIRAFLSLGLAEKSDSCVVPTPFPAKIENPSPRSPAYRIIYVRSRLFSSTFLNLPGQ